MNEHPAQAVSRFAAEWESTLRGERNEPPRLQPFLPDGRQARLALLTELVWMDVRRRRRRAGLEKRILDYRTEFPEVTASPEYADLVFEEFLACGRRGQPDVETFVVDYPEVADEIRRRATEAAAPRPDPTSLPDDIETGRRLDDFDLLTRLGGTDHSRMFLARQRSMQRLVAVRVESGADSDTPTVAQLDHQHIVRVYDQRLIADGSTGKPLRLLYMQYHPGGTVDGVLTQLRHARATESTPAERDSNPHAREPVPVEHSGVSTPAGRPGVTASTGADGVSAPTDVDGVIVPSDAGGVSGPTDVDEVFVPSDVGGVSASSDVDEVSASSDVDEVSVPIDAAQGFAPSGVAGVSVPIDAAQGFAPSDVARVSASTDAAEVSASTDAAGDSVTIDAAGDSVPTDVDSDSMPTDVDSDSMPTDVGRVVPRSERLRADVRIGRAVAAARTGRGHSDVPRITGAVLLAAVDAAMEARGEIRSAASSPVRAEIAELSWPETVAWVGRRLAEALEYAQRHGVLHHDIRPGNVIFTAEGVPKLADFTVGPLYPPDDRAGIETLRYRSPEALAALDPRAALDAGYVASGAEGQGASAVPDTRSDIYSLGLLLWEMLTGTLPFDEPVTDGLPDGHRAVADAPESDPRPGGISARASSGAVTVGGAAATSGGEGAAVPGVGGAAGAALERGGSSVGAAATSGEGGAAVPGVGGAAGAALDRGGSSVGAAATPGGGGAAGAALDLGGSSVGSAGDGRVRVLLRQRMIGVPEGAFEGLPADTPATLRRVLATCLEVDPERRWQNGAELAGQLDLCLDARARDLVDAPPRSSWARLRGWPVPIAALCVGLPNLLASVYNIRLNQSLIVDRLSAADQERFATVALVNNGIAFPLAAFVLLWLARRPLTVTYRLARGRHYAPAELERARRDTLLMGERTVWVPFAMWILAGVAWPLGLSRMGAHLSGQAYAHFFAAQVVCAAIALAYPFFLIAVYSVRSLYPQLLARGAIGPEDRRQLSALARRANFYLAVAASVPLLGVASATFVSGAEMAVVIVTVRWLSVGGILAFVLSFLLFQRLEADLRALVRAIPQGARQG
ncbi:protein kinase domain-containing protein [Nocardia inohanensis]|uniref:protein kinase domain-containing protein n=1 Tax=Nocardia inohanensis TaxID=209246 RepID=UPI000833E2B5|nr:protein kinase [Nocardia inohanensis]